MNTNGESSILHVKDVYKSYNNKWILEDIDLKVAEGEFCTLVGPSGAGKSTLLRLILGQEQVSKGEMTIENRPLGFPNVDRGIVFQRYSLFPHLTVLDNVLLGYKLRTSWMTWRQRKAEFKTEALGYLKRVRLEHHGAKYPHELSGGMQQRVAIVQALITKPKILLMDEPFGALDPDTREDIQLFILELWEEYAMTIFFVTHDLQEAVFLGSRILVLSQHYSDHRGQDKHIDRGSKIVADYALPNRVVRPTSIKSSPEFIELIAQIRQEGFDPEYLQHVSTFNLKHPDSYQTLSFEETKP